MRVSVLTHKLHRWLAYAVGLQVLAWLLGGVLFALLPFQPWVKGADRVEAPKPVFIANDLARLLAEEHPPLQHIAVVATAQGLALKLDDAAGTRWRLLSNGAAPTPDATRIATFAQQLYRGDGELLRVTQGEHQRRLGLVRETGDHDNLWCAHFSDALNTRLYFDGVSGEYLFVRNNAWVVFDFFWRLHIMDYRDGEDFNNPLLQFVAVAALLFVVTGLILVVLVLRRNWSRRSN